MREYKAKPPDSRAGLAGRLEVWRNDDGTWSGSLLNAGGTMALESVELDGREVRGWVERNLVRALVAEPGREGP